MEKNYNAEEVGKFSNYSENWWDESGEMKMLHKFNPIRIEYIEKHITQNFDHQNDISILDIGCGCGILSEKLAQNHHQIVGIDPSFSNIKAAKKHAIQSGINGLEYFQQDEFLETYNGKFDIILAMEVLEHVDNLDLFFNQMLEFSKTNSLFIISTINKNITSLIFAKFTAEYILNILPKGTHDWKKFINPDNINQIAEKYGFKNIDICGVRYNPIVQNFAYSVKPLMNYFMCFKKC